ncbi:TonB-dependent siderophore receptor [Niveispirillum sp. BGYR6]|uniref:TonB-dependent siderophore receptor n=1 Tax=Niveispirillum sp. BGYR6 TaxID=2971249 RepID=UPI0022B9680F|nr:TonB-dependent siderophore receptor [Niveispirillum sp. BGYR6]MDG5495999.1 TonB-dependent siderophore receptor [Niveispirillum sp. BGYR6]
MSNKITSFLLSTATMLAVPMVLAPQMVMAQERTISVPAMDMGEALRQIASQSGTKIEMDPDAVRGLTSLPVSGARTAEEAIDRATKDTTLLTMPGDNGSLVIVNGIIVLARRDEAETSILVRSTSTSSRLGLSLREQARNNQVISSRLMAEQQSQTLADALRNAGGVVVNSATVQGGVNYSVRGFVSNGSVNGMPTSGSSTFPVGATQPTANIERLEVLKGPDAILLGGNNMGGTVNIVTKKPSANARIYGLAETDKWGLRKGTVDANGALTDDKTITARIIGTAGKADRNFGGYRGDEEYLIAPSLRYKNLGTDAILSATLSKQASGVIPYAVFSPTTKQPFAVDYSKPLIGGKDQGIEIKTKQINAEVNQDVTDWLSVVARGQHQEINFRLSQYSPFAVLAGDGTLLVSGSGVKQRGTNDLVDSFARVNFTTGAFEHKFVGGFTYTKMNVDADEPLTGGMAPYNFLTKTPALRPLTTQYKPSFTVDSEQRGYYGQYLVSAWDLHLLAGVRRNMTDVVSNIFGRSITRSKGKATTPNFGAVYDITPDISAFGTLAYGFQPTFITDRNRERLPDIKTRNAEVGVKLDLFDDKVLVNASWFRIRESNKLITDPAAPRFQIAAPGQLGEGYDLNITGEPIPGLSVVATFVHTDYSFLTKTSLGNVVTAQPKNSYSLYSSYRHDVTDEIKAGLGAGIYGRSGSAVDQRAINRVPSAVQVDVNAFLTYGDIDINLGVRNLFNKQNYASTISTSYVPLGEPRSWRLSIGYRFL